jgi:hypothetical protein
LQPIAPVLMAGRVGVGCRRWCRHVYLPVPNGCLPGLAMAKLSMHTNRRHRSRSGKLDEGCYGLISVPPHRVTSETPRRYRDRPGADSGCQ